MKLWFKSLVKAERMSIASTAAVMVVIVVYGFLSGQQETLHLDPEDFNVEMTLSEAAEKLHITGKSMAREVGIDIESNKKKPMSTFGVTDQTLRQAVEHLVSHEDTGVKYYVFAALCFGSFMFLIKIGKPKNAVVENRYPIAIYYAFLVVSVVVCGFWMGKSPNPMESIVKVFKAIVGLYPDPGAKTVAFIGFMAVALIGAKLICGWACPFGALQELFYGIARHFKIKQFKPPFILTNSIRVILFISAMLFLFGITGGQKGLVLYHYINPFNLFNLDFDYISMMISVGLSLVLAPFFYRPFCQLICPFGLASWVFEKLSIARVKIRPECVNCRQCYAVCPTLAIQAKVEKKSVAPDCFSCTRCLNMCPKNAIDYSIK